jgi:hypothetical protein
MTSEEHPLPPDSLQSAVAPGPRGIEPQLPAPPCALDLAALEELDRDDPDLFRPALAALLQARADRFDPIRIGWIQALADKAARQRPAVAQLLEHKARHLLSDCLDDYLPARQQAMSLVTRVAAKTPQAAAEICRLFESGNFKAVQRLATQTAHHEPGKPGPLAVLTRGMLRRNGSDELAAPRSLEEELRRQESKLLAAAVGLMTDNAGEHEGAWQPSAVDELTALGQFQQSLRQHHSQQRVTRVIEDGPQNAGPLNAQALVIRSLASMRALSPSYANRFVSYMDSLLWLEQAREVAAPPKSKRRRRKS